MARWLIDLLRPWSFRGKVRLLQPWVPRHGVREAVVHGVRMRLDLEDFIQRMVYLGCYERWETRVVRSHLRPGMTFVDVGANVGYFALLAARQVGPTGRVFAVEPSPYAADLLQQTLASNPLHQVRLARCALGAREDRLKLSRPDRGNHTPTLLTSDAEAGVVVPVRRLDDCLAEWNCDRVDLLKMDVEGFESRVLDGATEALARHRILRVLCEFNQPWLLRAGSSSADLHRRFLDLGFRDVTGIPWNPDRELSNRLFALADA